LVFPEQNLPLPNRPFPFDPPAQVLPKCVPDCHLVRTVIPCLPSYDSLGVFHCRTIHLLASFARMVSRDNVGQAMAISRVRWNLFPRILTQGRLHCTQHTILCTALQVHTRLVREEASKQGVLNFVAQHQVSTVTGSDITCHCDAPGNLNPQHPP